MKDIDEFLYKKINFLMENIDNEESLFLFLKAIVSEPFQKEINLFAEENNIDSWDVIMLSEFIDQRIDVKKISQYHKNLQWTYLWSDIRCDDSMGVSVNHISDDKGNNVYFIIQSDSDSWNEQEFYSQNSLKLLKKKEKMATYFETVNSTTPP